MKTQHKEPIIYALFAGPDELAGSVLGGALGGLVGLATSLRAS